ncbi:MAG: protein kinase [Clostridiales bacterium]|nr:protein kinase [Clostridiales bacterium]
MNMNDLKSGEPFFDDWYIDSYIGTAQSCSAFKIYREQDGLREYSIMKVIEISRDKYDECAPFEPTEDKTEAQEYKELVTDIYRKVCLLESLPDRQHIVSCEEHLFYEVSDPPGYEILIRTEFLERFKDSYDLISMTYQDVIFLGRNICEALDLCERYHIIHGDIQPDCIYLSEHGQYKLGDFSLIKAKEQEDFDSDNILLSVSDYSAYTAPEILSQERYDNRADIYSLGLVLYTFLNHNELPLDEKHKPLPRNGPKELGRVILKACEFLPEDRYQSAKEFQDALIAISVFLGDVLTEPINSNVVEEPEIYVAATQEDKSECDELLQQEQAIKLMQEELQQELKTELSEEAVQQKETVFKDDSLKEIDEPRVSLAALKRTKNMGPWVLAIWTSVLTIAVLILLIKRDFISMDHRDTVETGIPNAILNPTDALCNTDQTYERENPSVKDSTDEMSPTNEPDLKEAKPDSVTYIPEEESITLIHSGEELDSLEEIELLDEAKVMDFSNNAISNLSELSSSSKVETLKLNKNGIQDIRALKKLVTLKELDLADNEIVTVVSLKELMNLEVLSLSNNQLPNVLGIEQLTKLKMLYLDGNNIKDVSKLTSLKNLVFLDLSNNRLTEEQILVLQNALPNCIINY